MNVLLPCCCQVSVPEATSPGDQQGQVTLNVMRSQGTFGSIQVDWEITGSPENDLSPTNGSLFFVPVSGPRHFDMFTQDLHKHLLLDEYHAIDKHKNPQEIQFT